MLTPCLLPLSHKSYSSNWSNRHIVPCWAGPGCRLPCGDKEKFYTFFALSWRSTLSTHSASSGTSTHFQSRRQPKRGANARFHQTELCICHGSAHSDSFDLDPSKPQLSTKVEWIPASEKLWWKFPWLPIPFPVLSTPSDLPPTFSPKIQL